MAKKSKSKAPAAMPPLPPGFVREMEALLGPGESAELFRHLDMPPATAIRLNRAKFSRPAGFIAERWKAGADLQPVEWCPSGFVVSPRPDFVLDPLYHAGAYYVQEPASMVYESVCAGVAEALSPAGLGNPLLVLDLCAAPGGKSTAMLNGLQGRDFVLVANEFDRRRSVVLKENLDKWGCPDVIVCNSPASRFARCRGLFHIVAVDAPCSGEGMMRREQVARSQWSPQLVAQCASLQKEILEDACGALMSGGYLIYSTCTFNREENEDNVEWLTQNFDLELTEAPRRFMPHRTTGEGLFVAVLKKGGAPEPGSRLKTASPKTSATLPDYAFLKGEGWIHEKIGDRMFSMSPATAAVYNLLKREGINVTGTGVNTGDCRGAVTIPSSRQLLSTAFEPSAVPVVELGRSDALAYLRHQPFSLPEGTPAGYVGVAYEGLPLGLVKNLGNRFNTLHPGEWRVMKQDF